MKYGEITWNNTTLPPKVLYLWIKFIVSLIAKTSWCISYREKLLIHRDIGNELFL